jgi:hypothetical protein
MSPGSESVTGIRIFRLICYFTQLTHGVVTQSLGVSVSSGNHQGHSFSPPLPALAGRIRLLSLLCVLCRVSVATLLSLCRHIHTPAPHHRHMSAVRCVRHSAAPHQFYHRAPQPVPMRAAHRPFRTRFRFSTAPRAPSNIRTFFSFLVEHRPPSSALVLCRLLFESQTSPNRLFFVNIRFRFETKIGAPSRLSIFLLPRTASASTPDLSDALDPIQHAASRAGCIGASSTQ